MTKNVLIVDDSATMRKIIMRGIRQADIDNAEFREAGDGVEELEAVAGAPFDLILSDVNMPSINGLDFVTDDNEEVVDQAISRGTNGYLKKPFTPEKIQEVLGPHLQ